MGVELIRVPDVGSSDPVDVIEVSVKPGDELNQEDTVVVLESDKATIEVPAPVAGTVKGLLVKVGDRVKEGDPLLEVEAGAAPQADRTSAQEAADNTGHPQADKNGGPQPDQASARPAQPDTRSDTASAAKASAGSAPGAGASQPVPVPDLGDIDKAELIEFSVAEGDSVEAEQVLAVLESDKASLEIPAPFAGKIVALKAKLGDALGSGDVLLEMQAEQGAESASSGGNSPAAPQTQVASAEKQSPARSPAAAAAAGQPASDMAPSAQVHAGPAVRKLARELGVDLAGVTGSGPKQRILKEDVHAHVKKRLGESGGGSASVAGMPSLPEIDFSKFGDIERVELNKLRKVSASNLHRSWLTIPHVTQHDDADITELENFRQEQNAQLKNDGVKLTMLAFLVKACAVALQKFPNFNSSLENSGAALIHKHYINIGVAVDTPNGLVVPVIWDADKKGLVAIAREMGELAQKARDRKLAPQDMQGGTFSISSLGGIGGTAFTPIVNWPEVAILGVSRSDTRPVWNGSKFKPRLMLPLSLSYDHRVIDGADAARFITFLSQTLADMRRALL